MKENFILKIYSITLILILGFILVFISCLPKNSKEKANIEKTSFSLADEVLWASPKGFDLTMDIFTPNSNKPEYPVIIMFHGGAWLVNDNSIMQQSAEYLASHGEYVVCNVNYRLLGDLNNTVTFNEIVEDVLGAVLWVKEHIEKYKGSPKKIIVTGDSSGGFLATMIATQGDNLFSTSLKGNPMEFNPSWKPNGKTLEDILSENGFDVQAAIISYGSFDLYEDAKNGFEQPKNVIWSLAKAEPRGIFGEEYSYIDHPELYKKVSPVYNIPSAEDKKLPPILFTVGSEDNITPPASIKAYVVKMKKAGHQNIEYWVHKNRPHRFLESGSNEILKINFSDDAIPALNKMLSFLNNIFYE